MHYICGPADYQLRYPACPMLPCAVVTLQLSVVVWRRRDYAAHPTPNGNESPYFACWSYTDVCCSRRHTHPQHTTLHRRVLTAALACSCQGCSHTVGYIVPLDGAPPSTTHIIMCLLVAVQNKQILFFFLLHVCSGVQRRAACVCVSAAVSDAPGDARALHLHSTCVCACICTLTLLSRLVVG